MNNRRCRVSSAPWTYRLWWIAGGLLGIAAPVYFGWQWLLAARIASGVLAAAPCVAMCALGLCMRGSEHRSDIHSSNKRGAARFF